jgi:serine phosphatase RsbU (regulator of sigma subunit)
VELLDHLRFLNAATAAIGASPDMAAIVEQFADALVPRMADFACVHLLDALFMDGALAPLSPQATAGSPMRLAAVAHYEPSEHCRLVTPVGTVEIMHASSPCREAMATGQPVQLPQVDPAQDGRTARIHSGGDLTAGCAHLAVPLSVRGRVLGCVTLTRRQQRGAFDEAEVLAIGQLAAQAALGVDGARRYLGQSAVTAELRRGVLPVALVPPMPAGVEVAQRYLPGNQAAEVGGDWFDTIPLPGSRVGFVIGDVTGHNAHSAAVMGHLRVAVQTLAALDLPPDQLLRQLDNLAQRMGEDHLATCMYVVYDPIARICLLANAGHLPPLIVRADGRVEQVAVPSGAPIGVGGVAFGTVQIPIRDGDTLVMYTDGLVETRGEDIDERTQAVAERLRQSGPAMMDPEMLCDTLVATLEPGEREDDTALLTARLTSIPATDVAHWLLSPHPAAASRARRLIRQTLAGWSLSRLCDATELLATELVSNAIRYATRPIELRLLRTRTLQCEVRDDDHYLPILLETGDLDENGRGLLLVSRLAQSWGASRTAQGKVVWFELALADG